MNYQNLFRFEINFKAIAVLVLLAILPNILGMANLNTVFGFNLHSFQYMVFVAGAIYGPIGGAIAGGFGSLFSAVAMGNPYIVIGNIILGTTAAIMMKKGIGIIPAAMTGFAVQIPWIWVTDVYFMKMPANIVAMLIVALLFSNLIWAIAAKFTFKKIAKAIEL